VKRLLLAVTLLLLLAAAVVPWLIGERTEKQYQQFVKDLEERGFQVAENSYDRGWLVSKAETSLTPAEADWRLIATSHIDHGPFPWSRLQNGQFQPAAGDATTRLAVVAAGKEPQPLPLLVHSRVSLEGITRVALRSEQDVHVQDAEHSLALQGLSGDLELNLRRKRMHSELKLPLLALLQGGRPLLQLSNLETRASGERGPSGLNLGESSLTLERGSYAPPDLEHPLRVRGAEVRIQSGVEAEMVWVSAVYQARELEAGGERFANPELRIRTGRLSAPILARIDRDLRALKTAGDNQNSDALSHLTAMLANVSKLLEGKPELALERIYLDTPDGALEGRLTLNLSGLDAMELLNPRRWLEGLEGSGELAIPEPLLQRLVAAQLRTELEDVPSLDDSPLQGEWIEEEAQNQIERLVRQDLLQRREGRLYAQLHIGAGLLTINGKSIPLPMLAQLPN